MMIDDNEDYVTKSKLTITVKKLSKYNDRSRVAAKQKKQTDSETQKLEKIQAAKKKTY